MKTPFLLLFAATLVLGHAEGQAQENAAETKAAAPAAPAPKAAFALKHRSAFTPPAAPQKANPFWPIGWTPSAATTVAVAANAPEVTESNFVLSSVLLGAAPQLAVINGREYSVGDQVPVSGASSTYKAKLLAIRDGEAVLRYNTQDIVVALKIH